MARVGNHGVIIPRDKEMLRALYWDQDYGLPQIAALFDVTHKSVLGVFRELGIPTRSKGTSRHTKCVKCGKPRHTIKHAGNGAKYGRLCKEHWNEHRNTLAREDRKKPRVLQRKNDEHRRWYYDGPKNPQGESQWISKSRSLLRAAKRQLQGTPNREACSSQSAASEPEPTSRG